MTKPAPCAAVCAHRGCKRVIPLGALWCPPHVREAKTLAARNRLLGWLKTGRPES